MHSSHNQNVTENTFRNGRQLQLTTSTFFSYSHLIWEVKKCKSEYFVATKVSKKNIRKPISLYILGGQSMRNDSLNVTFQVLTAGKQW